MPGNTSGQLFCITTFGESHGEALGCVIDGCPSKIALTEQDIQLELDRRKPGQSAMTTSRAEKDKVRILSGVFRGKTLGTPIAMIVENQDMRPRDYEKLKNIFRPGHADFAWEMKFAIRDYRGGGRASGRETVSRVMAGAVAKKLLKTWVVDGGVAKKPIEIYAYTSQIGPIKADRVHLGFIEKNPVRTADPEKAKEMENYILAMKRAGDSCGGVIEILVKNMIPGLGEPVFNKLNAELAKALFSIPAVKAVEFGAGIESALLKGSEFNEKAGAAAKGIGAGISGGISTGEDLIMRVTVKAPSSIAKRQKMTTRSSQETEFAIMGRHDSCIIPRFIPVAESMVAITLADQILCYKAIKS